MLTISNNNIITVTRGDSFTLSFCDFIVNTTEADCTLHPGDSLYFGLMEPNQPFEHALIRKMITNDTNEDMERVEMSFTPEMTEFLMPGTYYYAVKIEHNVIGGEPIVHTLINKRKFHIID